MARTKRVKTNQKAIGHAHASRAFAARLDTLIFTLQAAIGKVGAKMPGELSDETIFLSGQLSGIAASLEHLQNLRKEFGPKDFRVKP